jgi:4-amino-4-deoxy-L-arabinose transferase-like glycosyltransferase
MSPAARPPRADHEVAGWKVALVLALLSTSLKVALLLFQRSDVAPAWVLPEEQHRGNIAQEVIEGPLLPVQDYQHAPNVGGSVVVGLLAVPFVALFGDSIAAVRAVPILFNALAVLLLVRVLDRYVSRRAAWIGGALFALAPPGYSLISITAFGTHLENNALTMLALLLYLELHRIGIGEAGNGRGAGSTARSGPEPARAPLRERRTALALGVVCGFALYFGYFFGVALLTMLVYELLHDKVFWLRRWFRYALVGFVVGFAPWISYNLATGFRGLVIYDEPITTRFSVLNLVSGGWHRFTLFFRDQLPSSFFFRGLPEGLRVPAGWFAALVLLALAAVAGWQMRARIREAVRALVSLRERPRDLGAPFLFALYLPIYLLSFLSADVGMGEIASRFAHDGRYCAPLYPFLCLVAACALDRIAEVVPRGRVLAHATTAGMCGLFFAGTLAVCDAEGPTRATETPGSSQEQFASWMAWTWRTDLARVDRIVQGVQTRRPPDVADGMIFMLAQGLKWGMRMQDVTTESGRAKFEKNAVALRHLHERVADAYKPYCEMPLPGEPIWRYGERDRFWAGYRHRERAARVRQPMALATP